MNIEKLEKERDEYRKTLHDLDLRLAELSRIELTLKQFRMALHKDYVKICCKIDKYRKKGEE